MLVIVVSVIFAVYIIFFTIAALFWARQAVRVVKFLNERDEE